MFIIKSCQWLDSNADLWYRKQSLSQLSHNHYLYFMTMSVNQKSIAALLLLLKVTKFFESLPFHEMKRNCAQKVPKEKLQKRVKNGSKISRTSPFEKKSFQITSVTRWLYLLFNFWLFTTMDIVITLPIFRPKSRKIGNVMTKCCYDWIIIRLRPFSEYARKTIYCNWTSCFIMEIF